MRLRLLATALVAGGMLSSSLFAAQTMREGNWQITMKMQMPGMEMPPVTINHCVTKEDLKDPKNTLPQMTKDTSCEILDYKLDGNSVSWKINCPKQKMTGAGKITYANDAYDGSMDVDMSGQKMHADMSGKRLGDCAK